MNRNNLNLFKTLIFIFGLIIVSISFYLFSGFNSEEGLTANQKFFWINTLICYLVFFIPFFFSSITEKSLDIKITSTITIWISVLFFEFVAITVGILVLNNVIDFKLGSLIELVVFFVAAIIVFFGYFAGNHINTVQSRETISLSKINEVKSVFDLLNLKVDMWSDDFYLQKDKVKKICENVKYLSPVDSELSNKLESNLILQANLILESTGSAEELDKKIIELTSLLKQRELLKK